MVPSQCGNSFFIQKVRGVELEWVPILPDETGNKREICIKKKVFLIRSEIMVMKEKARY